MSGGGCAGRLDVLSAWDFGGLGGQKREGVIVLGFGDFGLWSGDLHGNVTTLKAPRRRISSNFKLYLKD